MTSRLRRKLGDLGVDTSSAKANENFCLIGTPLPPLEKSRDTGEFVPLWKQEVRDEKGRRRLHGAFTGGFSAGYFNTVGSKEGWAPSEFKSSRGARAKQKQARPEDFMDDEDLAELRESQTLVDQTEEMDLLGGTKAEMARRGAGVDDEEDSITKILEASMLAPPSDSAGARILKKMGWRPGQGIGPRLTWAQKRKQDLELSQASAQDLPPEDDEQANKHTYARRDTPVIKVQPKEDAHGLGYISGLTLDERLGRGQGRAPGADSNLAAGFGLGALNDADEDDLDVYDSTSLATGRSRTAYDILDGDKGDREHITLGRSSQRQQNMSSAASTQTFRDGRPILSGFVLSDQPVAQDLWFPMPEIPTGWKPDPQTVWRKDSGKENIPEVETGPVSHGKWKTGITADQRGSLLGEAIEPSKPRSVFEYISEKDRERIRNIKDGQGGAYQPSEPVAVPRIEPHIAQSALRGFQPFTTDPVKQARYTTYLQSQASAGQGQEASLHPFPGQSTEEFNKELSDFAKSAQLFKPVSGAMAGRFTSAAIIDHGPRIVEGLHKPELPSSPPPEKEREKDQEKEEDPKTHAARMGMYGSMTREAKPWQPAKLLCKRFGVKDPNPEPVMTEPEPRAATSSWEPEAPAASDFPIAPDASFRTPAPPAGSGAKSGRRDLNNIGLGDDETQGRDILTYEKPSMDIFKAIFASDEESGPEDDADADADDDAEEPVASTSASALAPPVKPLPQMAETPAAPSIFPTNEKVDLATFKPTFVPRADRTTKHKEKDKNKRDKKKGKSLVSFEIDEDGNPDGDRDYEKPKKKRRKHKKRDDADADDSMWVEKPPPETVKDLVDKPLSGPAMDIDVDMQAGPPKARKKAVDFM